MTHCLRREGPSSRLLTKPVCEPNLPPGLPALPWALGCLWAGLLGSAANTCVHTPCRKELAEAHGTNKPCGKCYFYLLISKTFVEAANSNPRKKRSSHKKDELVFANAEEEFFYEVRLSCPVGVFRWS